MTILSDLLGIEIPIIQAPTGSIAGQELAAAVTAAGGLGSLGLTWTGKADALAAIAAIRQLTDRPFMVNYALSFEPVTFRAALRAGAPVVGFSWGDPGRLVAEAHDAGALVGVQVANARGATQAIESGADFLLCQGVEAGGHVQSATPLAELLDGVKRVSGAVPIVAAGGIGDAAGIADALMAGADGVMLGTRFVATQQSRAHPEYKKRLIGAQEGATALTICFDGGWPHAPHRVLRNSTLERWEAAGCPPPGSRPGEGDVLGTVETGATVCRYEDTAPRLGMRVDAEAMALYAGTGVGLIHDLPSAGDLVRALWRGCESVLASRV